MRRMNDCTSILFTLLGVSFYCSLISAQTVVLTQTNRGYYTDTGVTLNGPIGNYSAGDARGFILCGTCTNDLRNFFVFDLAGITQPITSAQLELYLFGPPTPGWINNSGSTSENYELHDVITPIANLVSGTGGLANHADLGTGIVYGSRTITPNDMGSVVVLPLNASAISALNAATGLFGIGGSVTTLDDTPSTEQVFTNTGTHLPIETTQLRLIVVPEPSTLLLLGIGAISLLGPRKTTSRG